MKLEFSEIDLLGMGAKSASGQGMGAKLLLSFLDTDAGLMNHVRLDIILPRSPEITFSDLQEAARSNSIEVLKAALSALEKHEIAVLEGMGEETRKEHVKIMFGAVGEVD